MRLRLTGIVQGVGFRPLVYRTAVSMSMAGYVLNNGSNVEVVLRGASRDDTELFMERLKADLVPLARIDGVEYFEDDGEYGDGDVFDIRYSREGSLRSDLPPDTPVCSECLEELFDPGSRRYLFPFMNCTNCGARYSLIGSVPYDRERTAMAPFTLCPACRSEYSDPGNRRFHAQTISCPDDGPALELFERRGSDQKLILRSRGAGPLEEFARRIAEGSVGVLKTWGGMHIVSRPDAVGRLRKLYIRPFKPFALMVRDVDAARRYARIPPATSLVDPRHPIAILPRREHDISGDVRNILEDVAPGLDNIGIFLPYSPIQHLLFHYLPPEIDALVMTSANPPGEPMAVSREAAFSLKLDVTLLHEREILQRVDDTVIVDHRMNDGSLAAVMVRKSRGYVPDVMYLPPLSGNAAGGPTVVSLGAERNVSGCVLSGERFYTTQYIGDSRNYHVLEFLEQALDHLRALTDPSVPGFVALDLHPGYATRRLARRLARDWGSRVVEVQHHHAHAFSLLVDAWQRRDGPGDALLDTPFPVVTVDGTGYGTDRQIWGGEVIVVKEGVASRSAHLEYAPFPGGDASVKDPRRYVLALRETVGMEYSGIDGESARVLRTLIPKAVRTSSLGRLMDALSTETGLCDRRTYDGEPAMRLEPLLNGIMDRGWRPSHLLGTSHGEVRFLDRYAEVARETDRGSFGDGRRMAGELALGAVEELTRQACYAAEDSGSCHVGLSGGVALNRAVMRVFELVAGERGLEPVLHGRLPPGDGGISAGQAVMVYLASRHGSTP